MGTSRSLFRSVRFQFWKLRTWAETWIDLIEDSMVENHHGLWYSVALWHEKEFKTMSPRRALLEGFGLMLQDPEEEGLSGRKVFTASVNLQGRGDSMLDIHCRKIVPLLKIGNSTMKDILLPVTCSKCGLCSIRSKCCKVSSTYPKVVPPGESYEIESEFHLCNVQTFSTRSSKRKGNNHWPSHIKSYDDDNKRQGYRYFWDPLCSGH